MIWFLTAAKLTEFVEDYIFCMLMNYVVIDIGNTDMVLGYYDQANNPVKVLRIGTKYIKDNSNVLNDFFTQAKQELKITSPISIVFSSVVPAISSQVQDALIDAFQVPVMVLDKSQYHLLPLHILQPEQIGTDLVANALAAHALFKQDCIIVDFGTALSFTTITATGHIIGVSIAPGIKTALSSLTDHAAQLQDVPLIMPTSALGLNTEHAIQAGIMFGYDGLVRGIIHHQEKELDKKLFVIVTGGLSRLIHTLEDRIDHFSPHLTLLGLKLAGELIAKGS